MENENTNRKKLIIGASILLVVAIIAMGGYLLSSPKKPAPGTITNQANQSQAPAVSPLSKIKVTPPPPPVFSNKSEISVGTQGFDPAVTKVKVGTLITWVNQSGQEAAIVSDPPGTHDAYPGLNLGKFPNGSGVSAIFNKAGTYGYHNYLHPEQTGTIIVE